MAWGNLLIVFDRASSFRFWLTYAKFCMAAVTKSSSVSVSWAILLTCRRPSILMMTWKMNLRTIGKISFVSLLVVSFDPCLPDLEDWCYYRKWERRSATQSVVPLGIRAISDWRKLKNLEQRRRRRTMFRREIFYFQLTNLHRTMFISLVDLSNNFVERRFQICFFMFFCDQKRCIDLRIKIEKFVWNFDFDENELRGSEGIWLIF